MTPAPSRDSLTLTVELKAVRRQLDAIEAQARDILDGLTEAQLAWQPESGAWSIAECLDHLIVTGRRSLSHIAEATDLGRRRGMFSPGPFRYGVLERWLVWLMGPPARMKFTAPRAYAPASKRQGTIVADEFLRLQHELRQSLYQVNGLDLARVKVSNPVSRWFRLSLGQELAFTAAHERRHLWQVQRIKARRGFPAG
jgi:hypothetical protein